MIRYVSNFPVQSAGFKMDKPFPCSPCFREQSLSVLMLCCFIVFFDGCLVEYRKSTDLFLGNEVECHSVGVNKLHYLFFFSSFFFPEFCGKC